MNPASPVGGSSSRAPDYRIGVLHSRLVWCLICRLCLFLCLSVLFPSPCNHTSVSHMMPQNVQTGTSLIPCLVFKWTTSVC